MTSLAHITVDDNYRITLPPQLCHQLGIQPSDNLLLDTQDGLLILQREPISYTAQLTGLHREIWQQIDTTEYLQQEREQW